MENGRNVLDKPGMCATVIFMAGGNGKALDPTKPDPLKFVPKPPAERRARRLDVVEMLLAAEPYREVVRVLSAKHNASPTTIKADIRAIYAQWAREDGKQVEAKRARIRRRLEAIAGKAERERNWHPAIRANLVLAKIAGMIAAPNIVQQVNVHQGPEDPLHEILADREVALAIQRATAQEGRPPRHPGGNGHEN